MVFEVIACCIFWLNAFLAFDRISDDLSPRTLVTGMTIDGQRYACLEFREYVHTHEEHTNDMNS